ncbi:MAG TPA: hypothetical protein VMY77_08175 [Chitinophagaceae bacterium]|nr:hypothetical protein [Chitinophagaceae bacterium]
MEVHKHPHHVTHKKKWTEYLLEFFMLFLAVFLGFVAENIREDSVEHRREKEYIKSLVQNLKDDTVQLKLGMSFLPIKIQKMDSLVQLSKTDITKPENLKAITRIFFTYGIAYYIFKTNNATLSQLKAGSFRLIQKDHIADSIAKYDRINSATETVVNPLLEFHNNFIYSGEQLMDYSLIRDTAYYKNGIVSDITPPAITADKEKQKEFFNKAIAISVTYEGYLRLLKRQREYAVTLITLLQSTYHLENE